MICPNCKNENRDNARFCDQCGAPLDVVIPQEETAEEIITEPETDDVVEASAPDELDNASQEEEETSDDENNATVSEASEDEEIDPTETLEPVSDAEGENGEFDVTALLALGDLDKSAEEADTGADVTEVIPRVRANTDLSGFDETVFDETNERLVSSDYEAPSPAWHDGATMQLPRIADEEAAKSKNYRASGPVDKKRTNSWRLVIAIVMIVAIALAAITYSMEIWGGKSVPNVVGLTQADAASVLQERGFTVRATKVKSDDTEGLVLIMDPSSGSRSPQGSEVVIHVSIARYIPDVVGKSEEEARKAMSAEGFENVSYVKERSMQPEGTVLSITPAPGEAAKNGSVIIVKVSDPFRVPDVTGMYLEDAMSAIEEAGLSPYIKNYYTEDQAEGYIVGTEPQVGSVLEEGSSVAILITRSRANELVAATRAYLAPGSNVFIGSYYFEISECTGASYIGNNMVSYSIMARPFITDFGETAYFSLQPYSGVITWSDDNSVIAIS